MTTELTCQYTACPDALTDEQIASYRELGYIAFTDVITPTQVEQSRQSLSDLIRLCVNTKFPGDVPFERRKLTIQFEAGCDGQGLSDVQRELQVRKLMYFHDFRPFDTLTLRQPKIQGVLRSLLGPDPILYQTQALIKPPRIGREKPWHQDNAYFSVVPYDAIVGVWIALDDARVENGCMHVIPGGHHDGPKKHHHTFDCEIAPGRLDTSRAVPIELPAGGAMFFDGTLPHQTPPNRSEDRRRAVQFHYRGANTRIIDADAFDKVFAEDDHTPATCHAAYRRRKYDEVVKA